MATLVSFHAHPDDECIACGGVIRKAADAGHRVVLVVATRGEQGEIPEGLLADGEQLWQRRVIETQASKSIGYRIRRTRYVTLQTTAGHLKTKAQQLLVRRGRITASRRMEGGDHRYLFAGDLMALAEECKKGLE